MAFKLFLAELCISEYGLEFDAEWSLGLGLLSKASAENGETLVSFLIEEDPVAGNEDEVLEEAEKRLD